MSLGVGLVVGARLHPVISYGKRTTTTDEHCRCRDWYIYVYIDRQTTSIIDDINSINKLSCTIPKYQPLSLNGYVKNI